MQAEGVSQAFDSARAMLHVQAKTDADKGLAGLLSRLDAPPEVVTKLRKVHSEFINSVTAGAFRREDLAAMWADSYGEMFTDEELEKLLAFYQSPLGQKAVTASRSVMPKIMEKMQADLQPRLQPEIQRYTELLRKIVADCNCERAAGAPEK
jgi:hypothetical protein